MNIDQHKLKNKLISFLDTLSVVNKKNKLIQVVFATKYTNCEQFVKFLGIARELKIAPIWIGENRVQEAEKKLLYLKQHEPAIQNDIYPVMIGNLQTNKINRALTIFRQLHAVDSLRLASAVNSRIPLGRVVPIFLEVNISTELSKHGITENDLGDVINQIRKLKQLELKGLMTMSPLTDQPESSRPIFRQLRILADKYNLTTSMGTSFDWKIAVEEGADFIRIGSLVFD